MEITHGKATAGRPGGPTFVCETNHATQDSSAGKEASKPLAVKICGGCGGGRKIPSLTGELAGETDRVLEHTQTHLPGNQHQKG